MEQITIFHEDGSVTIITTMQPIGTPPPEDSRCGLQLIDEDEGEEPWYTREGVNPWTDPHWR